MKRWSTFLALSLLSALALPGDAEALRGRGLPGDGQCRNPTRFTSEWPMSHRWLWSGGRPHLQFRYTIPRNPCWVSFHADFNSDGYSGGADNWSAALYDGRYLEIMIPTSVWMQYTYPGDPYGGMNELKDHFWVWSYYSR